MLHAFRCAFSGKIGLLTPLMALFPGERCNHLLNVRCMHFGLRKCNLCSIPVLVIKEILIIRELNID